MRLMRRTLAILVLLSTGSCGLAAITEATAASASDITRAEYDALATGMSYEQAAAIVGAPGELVGHAGSGFFEAFAYEWQAPAGAHVTAIFQGGRLLAKSNIGLD